MMLLLLLPLLPPPLLLASTVLISRASVRAPTSAISLTSASVCRVASAPRAACMHSDRVTEFSLAPSGLDLVTILSVAY